MSFIVLRRASSDRWEAVGPRLSEMSEFEAESRARSLALNYPNQEYAIAEITKIFGSEREVVARSVGPQAAGANATGRKNCLDTTEPSPLEQAATLL